MVSSHPITQACLSRSIRRPSPCRGLLPTSATGFLIHVQLPRAFSHMCEGHTPSLGLSSQSDRRSLTVFRCARARAACGLSRARLSANIRHLSRLHRSGTLAHSACSPRSPRRLSRRSLQQVLGGVRRRSISHPGGVQLDPYLVSGLRIQPTTLAGRRQDHSWSPTADSRRTATPEHSGRSLAPVTLSPARA